MTTFRASCTALGADGMFCDAGLDVGPGTSGEERWCSARLHRWTWDGSSWSHDPTAATAA